MIETSMIFVFVVRRVRRLFYLPLSHDAAQRTRSGPQSSCGGESQNRRLRICRCTGLIDTGNQLYEPLTRTPVMVMEACVWEDVLPASWIHHIRKRRWIKLFADMTDDEPFIWQDRLRLVPYRGVNSGAQFMLAIKPDLVIIVRDGEQY